MLACEALLETRLVDTPQTQFLDAFAKVEEFVRKFPTAGTVEKDKVTFVPLAVALIERVICVGESTVATIVSAAMPVPVTFIPALIAEVSSIVTGFELITVSHVASNK